jgi:hypothetical protein
VPIWLFVLLSCVDVIYYVASFQILYMVKVPSDLGVQGISSWDYDHILMPAMELRELAFLVLVAWIVLCKLRPLLEDPGSGEAVGAAEIPR